METSRITRSRAKDMANKVPATSERPTKVEGVDETPNIERLTISNSMPKLPAALTPKNTGMDKEDVALLQLKRTKLRSSDAQVSRFVRDLNERRQDQLTQAALGTFVFAQYEAGTAVCISPDGVLLTCSHCVADTAEEAKDAVRWLVSASGRVVKTSCVAWDSHRDLALLKVVAAEERPLGPGSIGTDVRNVYSYARIAAVSPTINRRLMCIGHPGSEDLETSEVGVETGYDVLHISEGRFRGNQPDQDLQDNSEIGCLRHDCWTYWGHSGAPLIELASGRLVGLHSSWDDETGMRRGIALEAIKTFLERTRQYHGVH